jgi:hypothetical protein
MGTRFFRILIPLRNVSYFCSTEFYCGKKKNLQVIVIGLLYSESYTLLMDSGLHQIGSISGGD